MCVTKHQTCSLASVMLEAGGAVLHMVRRHTSGDNLSADPNNAFFTDGVHEEILTSLASHASGLDVISRTTMATYKGCAAPPVTFGPYTPRCMSDAQVKETLSCRRKSSGRRS